MISEKEMRRCGDCKHFLGNSDCDEQHDIPKWLQWPMPILLMYMLGYMPKEYIVSGEEREIDACKKHQLETEIR